MTEPPVTDLFDHAELRRLVNECLTAADSPAADRGGADDTIPDHPVLVVPPPAASRFYRRRGL